LVGEFFEVRAQVDRDLTTVSRVDRRLGLIKNLGRHSTPLVTNSEEMFPPTVLIVNASLVLQEFSPKLLSVLPFMKLCVASESNNIRAGLPQIENVPIITGAPFGISPIEVKLSLPILA
jgi:hypothetical protein